jgi:DNA-binding transcriptional MerR regulator
VYTVKQLSKIAGITPRTLHYYDEIGLLNPSEIGGNGYRYYDEKALLRLQQILLYRKMEMPLDEIRRVMGSHDFDILEALEGHKKELQRRKAQLQTLEITVDQTISYMKGKNSMTTKQLFTGFTEEQQAEYEKEAMKMYDPKTVKASNAKWKSYSPEKKQEILNEGKDIYLDMIAAMPKGAGSAEVQACVERWRRNMDYFWTPNLDQLVGLTDLYNEDPRFKANFDQMHPELAVFFREAVREYVKRKQ